jgi:hypothetical protein
MFGSMRGFATLGGEGNKNPEVTTLALFTQRCWFQKPLEIK